jgi:hypothetical protein
MFQNTRQVTPDPIGMSRRKEELRHEIQEMGAYAEDQQKQIATFTDLTDKISELESNVKKTEYQIEQLNLNNSSLLTRNLELYNENLEKEKKAEHILVDIQAKDEERKKNIGMISDQEQMIKDNQLVINKQVDDVSVQISIKNDIISDIEQQGKELVMSTEKLSVIHQQIKDNNLIVAKQNELIEINNQELTTKNLELMSLADKVADTQNIIDSNSEIAKQILVDAKIEADKIMQEANNYKKEIEGSLVVKSGDLSKREELLGGKINQLRIYKASLEKHFGVPANKDIVI